MTPDDDAPREAIAVVGVAGRLPGATDVDAFWANELAQRGGFRRLSVEELRTRGRSDAEIARRDFVPLSATIDDIDRFDAAFFRFTPGEAELLDPQIRLLHEVAWHVLENAGCDPERTPDRIGVFASANVSTYWLHNLAGAYRHAESRAPSRAWLFLPCRRRRR
jgi:acyl transferase domain-containing protein